MIHRSKLNIKTDSEANNAAAFVVPNVPFVWSNTTPILPFIGQNKPLSRFRPKLGGFTLVELMIALVVAGILLGIGVPSFKNFVKNNRIVSQVNELLADLTYARSEALKRSRDVHICKTLNPKLSNPTCNANASDPWSTGWITWVDLNGNGIFNSPAEILRISEQLKGGNVLSTTDAAIQNEIVFTKLGILSSSGGTLNLCDDRGSSYGRIMEITTAGRPTIKRNPTC